MQQDDATGRTVDLRAVLSQERERRGAVWSQTSEDLNINLVRWDAGEGVAGHVNTEVDVLLLGVEGEGEVVVNGAVQRLAPGLLCLVPRGAARAIRSAGGPFAYVTCHRRRGGLMPA